MSLRFLFIVCILCLLNIATQLRANQGESLSRNQQLELIGHYKFIGAGLDGVPVEAAALIDFDARHFPLKCGSHILMSYVLNYNNFEKDLVDRYSLKLAERPTQTNETYDSPAGLFKIHFTRTGGHAVYQADSTTGGVPNFVIGVAGAFDSVYFHEIDTLGYPKPPSDGGYPSGIDSLYDVYLVNLSGNYFGLTYPDSLFFSGAYSLDASSFIVIDNDYQETSFSQYHSQPLNAVRIAAAHEYFHAIQYAIDFTESEDYAELVLQRRYWYEMSAVWMEEEVYDGINGYYTELPYFFNQPRASIQQFNSFFDSHPYASAIFPIFLTEKFGRDIIRPIWLKCGQLGLGPNFLEAAQAVIDSVTSGAENFRSVFGEFTLWNYFTGARASLAPVGVGYSEKEFYPEIPESAFTVLDDYPANQVTNFNLKSPEPNSAAYFKLNNTRAVFYSDSADTMLRVALVLGDGADSSLPQGWHINIVHRLDSAPNQYIITDTTFPDDSAPFVRIAHPRQYRSIDFILTPASFLWQPYSDTSWGTQYGYFITDSLVDILIDTSGCCESNRGDFNGDGLNATILDLNYLVNNIFRGGPPSPCEIEADANGDYTASSIQDLNFLVNDIFRGGPSAGACY